MASQGERLIRRAAEGWARHRETLLRVAVALLAVIALAWLTYETYRLVWRPTHIGARAIHRGGIDFAIIRGLTVTWFQGVPIYEEQRTTATYPPASYALFWALLGWLPSGGAKLLWGITAAAALGWLVRLTVRESRAETPSERALAALIPLSMYATGATVGNGQFTIHLLALIAGGLSLLRNPRWTPGRAALGSVLVLASLVKPTVSAPFCWIALFASKTVWPAACVAATYAGLTVFAASFQETGLSGLLKAWLRLGLEAASAAGESNLQLWLAKAGLESWALPAALLVLGALGLWIHRHRRADLWVLVGVTAVVARLWSYHRWYDDMLLLFPLLALFRVAKEAPAGGLLGPAAGILFSVTLVSTLAPGGLYLLPASWTTAYTGAQSAVWIAALLFLAAAARRSDGGRLPGACLPGARLAP
ncbi:MAG: DUF2029 domain-containing protein [Deltaproteobacteria bacterium]|nr:DUF2029 domain-containing protein [Deltaproteobacteria bacterium]